MLDGVTEPNYCLLDKMMPRRTRLRNAVTARYLAEYGVEPPQLALDEGTPWDRLSFETRKAAILGAHDAGKKAAIFLYEMTSGDAPTFRYFGYSTCQALDASASWEAQYFYTSELAQMDEVLAAADAAVLIRMRIRPDIVQAVEKLHEHGCPVAYLIDDDVVGEEKAPRIWEAMGGEEMSEYWKQFWRGVAIRFKQCADLCDCFIAPVPYFAELLQKEHGKPAYVLHSFINDEQIRLSGEVYPQARAAKMRAAGARAAANAATGANKAASWEDDDWSWDTQAAKRRPTKLSAHPFTLGYFSGTESHAKDFEQMQAALVRFLRERNDARLLLVGRFALPEDIQQLYVDDKVRLLPFMDYTTMQLVQATCDVALAPLVVDEFTNCKSALKVFEAGACGTPSIASPSSAYKESIENEVSGLLCETEEEWYAALVRLAEDPQLLASMGEAARNRALAHSTGEARMPEMEAALDAVAAAKILPSQFDGQELLDRISAIDADWDDQLLINPLFCEN